MACRRSRLIPVGCLAAALACALLAVDRSLVEAAEPEAAEPESAFVGAAGCAAASCHGSPQPGVVLDHLSRGSEYPLWLERDPHARSWRTMTSEQATTILTRLQILDGGTIADVAGFQNCLACHATVAPSTSNTRYPAIVREGVGCEACHGGAADWVDSHTLSTWSPDESSRFVRMDDLLTRARHCAACHVGDHQRDMNHDLIAAGHPPLRFDFATYHNRLPKHWREDRGGTSTTQSQLWLAGIIAQTQTHFDVMASRVTQSLAVSQWPELASYDCASCHHALDLANERGSAGGLGPAVSPRPAGLHTASFKALLVHLAARSDASDESHRLQQSIEELETLLVSSYAPDPLPVATALEHVHADFARWLTASRTQQMVERFTAKDVRAVVAQMAAAPRTKWSWEYAAATYLAAVAAHGDTLPATNVNSDGVVNVLSQIRRGLAFPAGQDTPRFLVGVSKGTTLTRREVQAAFEELVTRWHVGHNE